MRISQSKAKSPSLTTSLDTRSSCFSDTPRCLLTAFPMPWCTFFGGFVQGTATCLQVALAPNGSHLVMFAGPVTSTNLPDHQFGAFWMTDSGQPGGAGDLYNAYIASSAVCYDGTAGGINSLQS